MRIGDPKIHAVNALEKEYRVVDDEIDKIKAVIEVEQNRLAAFEEKRKGITEALNLIRNNS